MTTSPVVTWLDVYDKLVTLEVQLQDLRKLLWELRPEDANIQCRHPVDLEGLWAGTEITEQDFTAAERTMFPYDHKLLIANC